MSENAVTQLLADQIAYYRARAPEYLDDTLNLPGAEELDRALKDFAPTGDVLELACGPGVWTPQLQRHATGVTAGRDARHRPPTRRRDPSALPQRRRVRMATRPALRRGLLWLLALPCPA